MWKDSLDFEVYLDHTAKRFYKILCNQEIQNLSIRFKLDSNIDSYIYKSIKEKISPSSAININATDICDLVQYIF